MLDLLNQPPTVQFCEAIGNGIIARPYYAISNLAFFVAAYFIYKKGTASLSKFFAGSIFLVGLFSLIYDCQPIRLTQLIDIAGMYTFANVLLVTIISQRFKMSLGRASLITTPPVFVGYLVAAFVGGQSGNIFFGILLLSYIGGEAFLANHTERRYFLGSLAILAVAFGIWSLDVTKTFCLPGNYLNGRGVFHILTAVCAYLIYLHHVSKVKETS